MVKSEKKTAPDSNNRKPGRPVTGSAMSDAERARLYRLRKKAKGITASRNTNDTKTIAELQRDLATMTDIASKLIDEKQARKKIERSIFVSLCQAHLKIQMKYTFL